MATLAKQIITLNTQNEVLRERNQLLQEGMTDLLSYVAGRKFFHDTRVQTGDIMLRINEVLNEVMKVNGDE